MKRNDRNWKDEMRRMGTEIGVFALALGVAVGSSANVYAQFNSGDSGKSGPKEFFERLRPPFMKKDAKNNPSGAADSSVPSGFADAESSSTPAVSANSTSPATPAVSANPAVSSNGSVPQNDGFAPIGTAYATPTSAMKPSESTRLLNPSAAYNPSSAPRNRTAAYPPAAPSTAAPSSAAPPASSGNTVVLGSPAVKPTPSGTGNSTLPDPFPVNQRVFHLPYGNFLTLVSPDQLKEVRLYVSRNNGVTWQNYQTLSREQIQAQSSKDIPIRTGSDGEFWFSLRVVDQKGTEIPGESPSPTWRILVNTTGQPMDSLMNANKNNPQNPSGNSSGNPSGSPLAAENSGTARPQWSPTADATPGAMGNPAENSNQSTPQNPNIVIYSVKDRTSSAIPDVSLPVYRIQNSKPIAAFQTNEQEHVTAKPRTENSTNLGADESPASDASTDASTDLSSPDLSSPDSLGLDSIDLDASGIPSLDASEATESTDLESSSSAAPAPSETSSNDDMLLMLGDTPSANEEGINSKIRYMNAPRLSVDYDVSMVGSSGVGRVELWGTLDAGQTWTYMAEDKDCTSPIEMDLKSDGRYGLAILIFNGAGVGMERPQSGAAPQMEVVLDRINPRVQLYTIQLQAEFGDLEITWGAEDLNFGSNPVLLSWSSSTEGPWRAMTPMPLENSGRYNWRIPEGVPGKVYIRIDVCDLAKNSTTLVTGPVVTDVVRPTGVILDAKPAGK